MRGLIPGSFIASPNSTLQTNDYLEFIVNLIVHSKSEEIIEVAQNEIIRLIQMVFGSSGDKQMMSWNISFIKAYLLSSPEDK